MKTHYYGGIKKYQWAAIPLAMHGIVFLKDGSPMTICIGEKDDDPVLTIQIYCLILDLSKCHVSYRCN
jgi:aspartyl aminopeptidase